ncbi:hypothetical protein HDV01_005437 [Terramyces sp. JEL0728]|nr:hypothetical protein HDV01_005437 [Terramyces sp. JEL0728]
MAILHNPKDGRAPGWKRVIAGSLSGMMGAVSCNPFELVKTRLQSAATGKLAVGHQYGYTGVISALVSIYKQDGISGLYRGSFLSMGRSFFGSGANLASFSLLKEYLSTDFHWDDDVWLDMVCGLGSGVRDSFKAFDADNDGSLSAQEVGHAVQTIFAPIIEMGPGNTKIMVDRILAKSQDKTKVSFQEYGVMEQEIKAIYKELQKASQ